MTKCPECLWPSKAVEQHLRENLTLTVNKDGSAELGLKNSWPGFKKVTDHTQVKGQILLALDWCDRHKKELFGV